MAHRDGRFALLAAMGVCAAASAHASTGVPTVEEVLRRLDDASQTYRERALKFTCEEKIAVTPSGRGWQKFHYIYIRDEKEGLRNYRMERGTGGKARAPREANFNEYFLPRYIENPYSWMLFFSASEQAHYRHELAPGGLVHGRRALQLRFEPLPPYHRDDKEWYGTAWIDRTTFELLKVDAIEAEGYDDVVELERSLARAPHEPGTYVTRHRVERVVTDFSIERDGLRLPERVVITATDHEVRGGKRLVPHKVARAYRVEHVYSQYRFYGVETEEEIQDTLAASETDGR